MKKYHIVYKTTNKINGKFYIGLHSTNNLNDNYLGSGWVLKDAIKKYGKENFIKEILFIYDSRQLAMKKEAELVNEDFIKDNNNYKVGFAMHKKLYWIYYAMLDRCYNIKSPRYKDYGARGIKVCDEWKNDNKTFFKL